MAAEENGKNGVGRESGRPNSWSSSSGINSPKWRNLGFLAGLSCLILFQYQNCAQAPQGLSNQPELVVDDPSPVTVIDDVKGASALSFSQKQVEIHSATEAVSLVGHCPKEQEGSILAWRVQDSESGRELGRGFAQCIGEQFLVELAPAQELECDQEYQVSARLGLGQPGEVTLLRRCAPSASVEAPANMKAQLASNELSSCVIERRDGKSCEAVCYAADGVVEAEREMSASSCGL